MAWQGQRPSLSCPIWRVRSPPGYTCLVARVAFVFTNPRHHLEMMAPVARELVRTGISCELVSLAELRGFDTPSAPEGLSMRKVFPFNLRRRISSTTKGQSEKPSSLRRIAQGVSWLGLAAALWPTLRRTDLVVIPNDAVFPYQQLVQELGRRDIPFVLMQEGIRFSFPGSYAGPRYAHGGATAVCAWGDGSAEHFIDSGVPASSTVVTGAPRFDTLDPPSWTSRGAALLERLGLAAPLVLVTNPIETQGYGTRDDKHALLAGFVDEAAPLLNERQLPVIVKSHGHEDPAELTRVFAATRGARWVHVLPDVPLYEVLASARAAIILTSTVGLEALMFRVPLGVLEIPGHEPAFEYVQRAAALPIRRGSVVEALTRLLEASPERVTAGDALVKRHFYQRGHAASNVATTIRESLHRAAK